MNLVEGAVQKKVEETLEMAELELNDKKTHNAIWDALLKKISGIFPTIGNKDCELEVFTTDMHDLCISFCVQDDNNFCEVKERIRPATEKDLEEGSGWRTVIESF